MFDSNQDSSGDWFDCINVGDDYEEKADHRKDEDLEIPGNSLVEIVGIRTINDDHFVHEVRLAMGEVPEGLEDDQEKFVPIGINSAFTDQSTLLKDHGGRITFTPNMVRFKGDNLDDANAKIFGRYTAPERTGKYSDAKYDEFERQESLFGTGVHQQLVADPAGHLKLPSDISMISRFNIQGKYLGWNCQGIYKFHTGEKTKGKKDDEDKTKNLLAFISPAVQIQQHAPIHYITHVPYSTYAEAPEDEYALNSGGGDYQERTKAVLVDGCNPVPVSVLRKERGGNQKQLVTFEGDSIAGSIKISLDDVKSVEINPLFGSLNDASLTTILENMGPIGKGNVKASVWPGRWLIEFIGDLAGTSQSNFKVFYQVENTTGYKVLVHETCYADTGYDTEVYFPYPVAGELLLGDPSDGGIINDAVAPGSFGMAKHVPGEGYVVQNNQCREYAGDGTPEL